MTESSRAQQIRRSLEQQQATQGPKETLTVPLQRGSAVLPVVTLPLSVPVLNAKSFRIAPKLADHPQATVVTSDPYGPEAQRIVTELVRSEHRHAGDLKESLKDGQDQPGVITREGVLINANTRCVLMRELAAEGDLRAQAIRVAVLPSDVLDPELLDLEAVLQKQKEHKDEYNLVSELMMLRTLHTEANMTEQQIARRQRLSSAKEVTLRFRVLDLMERARHRADPPLAIGVFARERDKLQNWKELLKNVNEIERDSGIEAADRHIEGWLASYLLGQDSVHQLRNATEGWVDRHLVDALGQGDALASAIAGSVTTPADPAQDPELGPTPEGLDLLASGVQEGDNQAATAASEVFKLTLKVMDPKPGATVTFPDGSVHPAEEVRARLQTSVRKGLEASKARIKAGGRYVAPERLLKNAKDALASAINALDEVARDPAFDPQVDGARSLLEEIVTQVEEANELLDLERELPAEDSA